jgi:hypothetical protein
VNSHPTDGIPLPAAVPAGSAPVAALRSAATAASRSSTTAAKRCRPRDRDRFDVQASWPSRSAGARAMSSASSAKPVRSEASVGPDAVTTNAWVARPAPATAGAGAGGWVFPRSGRLTGWAPAAPGGEDVGQGIA